MIPLESRRRLSHGKAIEVLILVLRGEAYASHARMPWAKDGGGWTLPHGAVSVDETPTEAAHRYAMHRLRKSIRPLQLLGVIEGGAMDYYLFTGTDDGGPVPSDIVWSPSRDIHLHPAKSWMLNVALDRFAVAAATRSLAGDRV